MDNNSDDSSDKLDKMARRLNDKYKKQNNINKNYHRQKAEICRGIDCLLEPQNSKYFPSPFNNAELQQSDFTSGLPTPLEHKTDSDLHGSIIPDNSTFSSDNSIFNKSLNGSLSLPENLSNETVNSFPDKVKTHLKTQTKHVSDVDTNEAILEHIKHCDFCRNHLTNFFNSFTPHNQIDRQNTQQNTQQNTISIDEIKKYSLFIFIGILIVLVLEVILRK
jgi:hypothetical protein